jgi:Cys-tRNA(Pro)/Cys-tRNA(Cys) deacylase
LGQRRKLPTLIDDSVLRFDTVFVSAGRRGLEIELSPGDLITLTEAEVRRVRREPEPPRGRGRPDGSLDPI